MIDWDSCVLWLDNKYFSESCWWDRSRYRNNGIVYGAKWRNGAFYFDGSNDYVNCGHSKSLDITEEITVEALVKPEISDSTFRAVVSKYVTTNDHRSWLLVNYNNMWRFYISDDGSNFGYVECDLTVGKRQHVVGKFKPSSGDNIFIYVNGELKDSKHIVRTGIYSSNEDVLVGSYNNGSGGKHKGNIGLVRVYSKSLFSSQIKILSDLTNGYL